MKNYYSDKVSEAIRLVWMQYEKEEIARGASLLQQAADDGDADAYAFLALSLWGEHFLWDSTGLPMDKKLAAEHMKTSVLRGSALGVLVALCCDGMTLSARQKMPFTSLGEAYEKVLEKAEAGDPFSQFIIGHAYRSGGMRAIDPIDLEKYPTHREYCAFVFPMALDWFRKAVQGDLLLAVCTEYEHYTEKDSDEYREAGKWLKYTAERGFPEAQHEYGSNLFQSGQVEEALRWIRQAADCGEICSYYFLGECYENGKGVEVNLETAFAYYQQAADWKHAKSQSKVGDFYFRGVGGVPQDYGKAVYWLNKADTEKTLAACTQLAHCYVYGKGVRQDYGAAFDVLMSGDDSGELNNDLHGIYLNILGEIYINKLDSRKGLRRAASYFKRAANMGNEDAKRSLARLKRNWLGQWRLR